MNIQPIIQKDFYKSAHPQMFPDNTTMAYNNLIPRKSRIPGVDKVVVFAFQYFIQEYLGKQWVENFFNKPKKEVISSYKRITDNCLGKDSVPTAHIEALHDLGYLPLKIKALAEGTLCPIGVPMLTYQSTHPVGYFLPGLLETILSTTVWAPMTVATIALEYRKILNKYAKLSGNEEFVQFQGHDFSMRGMSSLETACTSGAAHLLSFVGTDTIPSIEFLETYYDADITKELVGCSVPATEHAVMCMGGKNDELETISRLCDIYPTGILSVVLDTWDLTKVLKPDNDGTLMQLKDKILSRNGKFVVRPDSTPEGISIAEILYGKDKNIPLSDREKESYYPEFYYKGVLGCLAEIFGTTINNKGYLELNSKCGVIYGDGLGLHNIEDIMKYSIDKGYASTNIVCGFGSYGYQMISRDTLGFAIKCTYGIVNGESRNIYKNPVTDDGTKRSLKGLLAVGIEGEPGHENIFVVQECTPEEESQGLLQVIYEDGNFFNQTNLTEIRNKINNIL